MKICIPFNPAEFGGPSIFVKKFGEGLRRRKIDVVNDWAADCDVVLAVISAPPRVLLRAKLRGVPVVQRLDGVFYRAIAGNRAWRLNLPIWLTYRSFSDYIIFQSDYSQRTCERFMGRTRCPSTVIYNGVDLNRFTPQGEAQHLTDGEVLICLLSIVREVELAPLIAAYDRVRARRPQLRLAVIGKLDSIAQGLIEQRPDIVWSGQVPNDQLPAIYRGAALVVSTKLRQNCPNAVLEAMACGLPIACYDSGAHRELIGDEAGVCVPMVDDYGPLPRLEVAPLADAIEQILPQRAAYAQRARQRAEAKFDLEQMTEQYIEVFETVRRPRR